MRAGTPNSLNAGLLSEYQPVQLRGAKLKITSSHTLMRSEALSARRYTGPCVWALGMKGYMNRVKSKKISLYVEFHETYENGCIYNSESIGTFQKEVLVHDPRFRV